MEAEEARRTVANWPFACPAPTYIACSLTEPEERIGYHFDVIGFLDRGYIGMDDKLHEAQWMMGMSRLYHAKWAYTLGELAKQAGIGMSHPIEVYLIERRDVPFIEKVAAWSP